MIDHWGSGPVASADELDQLVYLSNLVGQDPRLVQPGGGNSSIKIGETLFVKGSGTDMRTIHRAGFTQLSLPGLAKLRAVGAMGDPEMMQFMARCMIAEGPAPSVETPLHALLPARVIVHTHDVPTMSLTDVSRETGERLVTELFRDEIVYVPYVRPGFPLAYAVGRMVDEIPRGAIGLALAHHGLVVWGDTARECHERLTRVIGAIDDFFARRRGSVEVLRPSGAADARRRAAEIVMPAIRGALGDPDRVVLHRDDGDDVLTVLGGDGMAERTRRGMATPEHVLRAGRLPVWIDLDLEAAPDTLAATVREQIARARQEYEAYHTRHAAKEQPHHDWAKVILVPGLGMITAAGDKRGAVTANLCYRAVLETIANAESVGGFEFLPERDVFEFEHWPLERRKVDEQAAKDRATKLVPRSVVMVIGGGSGIGKAAARRFVDEGAHVVVADMDADSAQAVAQDLSGRAIAVQTDVRDDASLERLFARCVLEYGGLDCLFYSAGLAPRFAAITDVRRADLQPQIDVHYIGAVLAIGRAATVMRRQGRGGAIVASVSKAAVAPGRDAVAYGGSKAALLQALRVAAVELGADGIRVNAINADQIETPMFMQFVRERARQRGVTEAEQLAAYRSRNLLGVSLIPAEAVADLAVLLASDRFRFTTGDMLTVDGGLPEAFPR
jgi:rhamnose utilization protein RhaD (predicted bifunctional aldolase and dehydrogenase)/NAD(P)-dependent dehydrogenase (short-subunit alcohol dehydrogenase family)